MKKIMGMVIMSEKEYGIRIKNERNIERRKCMMEWSKPLTNEQKKAISAAGIFEVTDAFWHTVNMPWAAGEDFTFAYKVGKPKKQEYMAYHELCFRGKTAEEIKTMAINAEILLS